MAVETATWAGTTTAALALAAVVAVAVATTTTQHEIFKALKIQIMFLIRKFKINCQTQKQKLLFSENDQTYKLTQMQANIAHTPTHTPTYYS